MSDQARIKAGDKLAKTVSEIFDEWGNPYLLGSIPRSQRTVVRKLKRALALYKKSTSQS